MKSFLRLIIAVMLLAVIPSGAASTAPDDETGIPFERNFTEILLDSTGYRATLTLPARASGRLPGVLLIGGNAGGDRDRDEAVSKSRLFKDLAEVLASEGYVVLRYEPTPSGRKGMRPMLSVIEKDARRGLKVLKERPEVDPSRILLISHDTGILPAVKLARELPRGIRGIVALSAPARSGDQLLVKRDEALMTFAGGLLTDTYHEALTELYDAVKSGKRKEIEKVLVNNAETLRIPAAEIPAKLEELTAPSMCEYAATDFGEPLFGLRTPLLCLYGEWDLINDPTANIVRIRRRNPRVPVRKILASTHMLQTIGDPYRPIPAPYTTPEALTQILLFLRPLIQK